MTTMRSALILQSIDGKLEPQNKNTILKINLFFKHGIVIKDPTLNPFSDPS